ncbi:MAG TPA: glycerophosphodiester phosphodiesterase family protein [Mycobacteriales bacterium]|nr:glycerophosphodiester phosphodiesterase family protein [Mycobacteriales bacterium]
MRRLIATAVTIGAVGVAAPSRANSSTPLLRTVDTQASPFCAETPEPSRWTAGAKPDKPVPRMELIVHRGAAELAPENTLWAFRYATAYDVEYLEVDVQQTVDHRYVAFHDLEVDKKTDGSGYINTMTYDQVRKLNAADNDKWKGSAYDPAQIPSLEEVLALAAENGVGVAFDLKESVTDTASVALMAARYGLVERSIFQPYVPGRAEQIKAVAPTARLSMSNQGFEELPGGAPRGVFYAATKEYDHFGSSLPGFDAGRINEAHDGCAQVMPNVYQGDVTGTEAGDLLHARALGADGAQVNNPALAVDVLNRPVATVLTANAARVCLLDAEHRQGLPGKSLVLGNGRKVTTGLGGCVALSGRAGRVRFAGDGSARPSAVG